MISREAKFNQYSKSNSSWIIQPSRKRKLIFLATEKPCPWSFIFIPIITTSRLQVNEHKFQLIKYFLNLDLMFESPENVLIKNIFRDILQCHKNTDIYYNKCNCRRIIWFSFFWWISCWNIIAIRIFSVMRFSYDGVFWVFLVNLNILEIYWRERKAKTI